MLKLLIGNQRFSSWSMRPWILMKQLGIPFEAEVIRFGRPDWAQTVRDIHPAGTVPVLLAGELKVADSLAIAETLAEWFPQAGVWPAAQAERARARALSAEMHASFGALRQECWFDALRQGGSRPLGVRAAAQLRRAEQIFAEADGAFLCGAFCAADAFYTPLALRVLQYGLTVSTAARAYIERLAALPAVQEWQAGAERERDWPAVSADGTPYAGFIGAEDALRLARQWVAAWNGRNLDAVLDLFGDDAVFVSPKAESFIGSARVEGKAAMRGYWTAALEKIPRIEFSLEAADWDPAASALTVIYRADLAGRRARAAERWLLDPAGRIRYGEAYYGASA